MVKCHLEGWLAGGQEDQDTWLQTASASSAASLYSAWKGLGPALVTSTCTRRTDTGARTCAGHLIIVPQSVPDQRQTSGHGHKSLHGAFLTPRRRDRRQEDQGDLDSAFCEPG